MTKNDASQSRASKPGAAKSRFPVLKTVAGVLVAGAIAWVIVDRFDTPSVLPSVADAVDGERASPKSFDKPLWNELSSAQQVALAPLEPEWNQMEGPRKRKWIQMSARFASLPASEQQRVHERMRQWMKLTPAQRELARENYSRTSRLAQGGDKAADWENYKQLSAEQKRQLANSPAATRHKSIPVALPEAPMLVTPTPCPPNTTRRGAECILIGTDTVVPTDTAGVPPAAQPGGAGPGPAPVVTPGPAASSPGADAGAIAAPGGQQAPAQAANASN